MSRKLIILPYNLYKSLLTAPAKPNEDLQGKTPLEEAKGALWRSKRVRPGDDLSARNVLHQQMLRSYLKARKEFEEKPLKLQMGELRTLLKERDDALKAEREAEEGEVEPLPAVASSKSILKLPKKRKKRKRGLSREELLGLEDVEGTSATEGTDLDVFGTPKISPKGFASSSSFSRSPYQTRRSASVSGLTQNQIKEIEARKNVQNLINYVKKDPERFGIQGNQILLRGRPVAGSDVARSISYILVPGWHGSEPQGTPELRSHLVDDAFFQIIKDDMEILNYRPHLMQSGEGKMFVKRLKRGLMVKNIKRRKNLPPHKRQFCKTVVFKPELWTAKISTH